VCDRANVVNRRSKQYQHVCELLHVTQYLKTPFFLPCVIDDFDNDAMMLSPLHLQHVKRSLRRITYSSLSLSDKPSVCSLCHSTVPNCVLSCEILLLFAYICQVQIVFLLFCFFIFIVFCI